MAAKTGYERLAQVDEFDEPSPLSNSRISNMSKSVNIVAQPTHIHRLPSTSAPLDSSATFLPKGRHRSNSGIDIKAINARLERYRFRWRG